VRWAHVPPIDFEGSGFLLLRKGECDTLGKREFPIKKRKEWKRVRGMHMPREPQRYIFLILCGIIFLPNFSYALESGSLYVSSRPSGATIYLDDAKIGETNTVINAIPVGTHKIKVELAGYERIEQIVIVKSGRTMHVPLALAGMRGNPAVRGNITAPPLQGLLSEFTNPWLIMLVLLLLTGVVILALIMKAVPARRSQLPAAGGRPRARPAKVKVLPKRLRIPPPVRGITLKKAALLGNYRIVEKIASGGMATIYQATHIKTGGAAVLKVPYDQFQNDHRFIERFRREAELGQKLLHENIIRIYEYGQSQDGLSYIAMEYLPGIDLRGYLDAYGKMPVKEAVRTIVQVCWALGYAHETGVIHRDIKPENIMLPDRRVKGKVVLMDFGVAHAAYLGTVGTRSTYLGTPYYMSPDQISRRSVDGRSDIYSLGVVFFEVLTGKRPFDDADPLKVLIKHRESPPPKLRSINHKIPVGLERIVLKMLAKRPADRYKSVEALLAALKRYTGREGIAVE
jgi:tRNA A-37 threonylcarbamoyl transferase component Bud32